MLEPSRELDKKNDSRPSASAISVHIKVQIQKSHSSRLNKTFTDYKEWYIKKEPDIKGYLAWKALLS